MAEFKITGEVSMTGVQLVNVIVEAYAKQGIEIDRASLRFYEGDNRACESTRPPVEIVARVKSIASFKVLRDNGWQVAERPNNEEETK